MDILSIIALILAVPAVLFHDLSQISFWQRKEYRWDRVRAALTERLLAIPLTFYCLACLTALLSWWANSSALALGAILLLLVPFLWRLFTHGVFRPRWSSKTRLIGLILAIFQLLLLSSILLSASRQPLRLAVLIIQVVPAAALTVGLVNWLTNPVKRRTIARASSLRRSLPALIVVGITGSYGKTTTKHILSQLLPTAAVSKEHRNSPYVIALDMLQQLNPAPSAYIVEMSAYRTGEIRELADLARPTIGVITNIGNQHLALFGSPEKIVSTKWELINSLPSSGTAVLNADDPIQVKQARSYRGRIVWFSAIKPAAVYADEITYQPDKISFLLHLASQAHPVSVPLLSAAYLTSLLAAIAAVSAMGVADEDIIKRLNSLSPYPRTMELLSGRNGSLIIDDSYSANEQSVLNAVSHLRRFSQTDRRIIMVPLIELGPAAAAVHQRLGQALLSAGARVYVYGCAWRRQLNQPCYATPQALLRQAAQNLSPATVILLEGRIPDTIRQAVLKH